MKTNIALVVMTFVAVSVMVYSFAYDSGHKAGVDEATNARTAFFSDTQRFPAAGGPQANGTAFPGQRGGGAATGFGALVAGLQGTVDKVEGNTLTVTINRGQQTQSVRITVGSDTTVQQFGTGSVSDLKAGARVLIGSDRIQAGAQGQAQTLPSDLTARSITILPANFGP